MSAEYNDRQASGQWSRRNFLAATGLVGLGGVVGCASEKDATGRRPRPDAPAAATGGGSAAPSGGKPEEVFTEPTRKLSGDLKILLWSHFVPAHDEWFDPFVKEWGKKVGVNVTVDHINTGRDARPHRRRDPGRVRATTSFSTSRRSRSSSRASST